MNRINFSHNWNNKLNHKIFTTIRKYDKNKYKYYLDLLGITLEVFLNGNKITEANLIDIDYCDFIKIPKGLLHTDTGIVNNYEIEDLFKKFGIKKEDEVLILTFENKNA